MDKNSASGGVLDVSGMSIRELVAKAGDGPLGQSIQQLLDSLEKDPKGVISAFSSFTS